MDKLIQRPTVDAANASPVKRQSFQPQDDKQFKLEDKMKVFDSNVGENIFGIETVSYI